MSQALIKRLLAQRESLFELAPGKRVKIRRPAEVEMAELRAGITPELLKRHVVDWEGFTEADLFGATVGSDSVVKFDPEVFAVVVADRSDWFMAIVGELMRLVRTHLETKAEAEKN